MASQSPKAATPGSTSTKTTGGSSRKPRRALLGKKIGMTQIYSKEGEWVPVTVLQVGPCTVLQVKTEESDGYSAVQLGFDESRKKKKKPQQAYLDRIGVSSKRFVREVPFVDEERLLSTGESGEVAPAEETSQKPAEEETPEGETRDQESPETNSSDSSEKNPAEKTPHEEAGKKKEGGKKEGPKKPIKVGKVGPGVQVGVAVFKDVKRVDVRGVTKGRGFSGVIRRHHFNAGPKSHGSKNIREPKSTGMHTDPGRVHKGKRMPGHMGAANRKVRNLDVVRMEEKDNLLLVKGAVPGPNGAYVYIEESLR